VVDFPSAEFSGLSSEQQKALTFYRDTLKTNKDFVLPYFQKWVRYYRLYAGITPPEIKATFSQVMLWYAYSIVDTELPTALRTQLTHPDWVSLEAQDVSLEPTAKTAERWVKYQMEKVQMFHRSVVPTFQSAYIFGTGYRFYTHKFQTRSTQQTVPKFGLMGVPEGVEETTVEDVKSIISGAYVNPFNVYPSPSGGLVNPVDESGDGANDGVIVMTWPTRDSIELEAKKGNFDGDQVRRFYESDQDSEADPASEWKADLLNTGGAWTQFSAPSWIRKMRNETEPLTSRRRVAWLMGRKRWIVVGDDSFLLYDGPPLLDWIPLAKFTATDSLDNWFGVGLIEPTEDLILSMILNFNNRLDYMAGTFHPPTFYPEKLIADLGGKEALDPAPYSIHAYPHNLYTGGIGNYIHHDRPADISQQTFVEEGLMQKYLEDIIGQTSNERLNSNTATVGASLISRDAARSMLRAINLDDTGVHDSAMLTLKFGAKFKNENEMIRTGAEEMPWEEIDHNAITDGYGVKINGMRHLAQAEETFKRQLSIAPMLLNNPQIRGQMEIMKQMLNSAHFDNIDAILNGPATLTPQPAEGQEAAQLPGGVPTSQNEFGSQQGRSGIPVQAGNALV